jgi:hypothetical protein
MTSDLNSSKQPDRAWHRMQIAKKACGAELHRLSEAVNFADLGTEFYELGAVPEWRPLSAAEHDHWITVGN